MHQSSELSYSSTSSAGSSSSSYDHNPSSYNNLNKTNGTYNVYSPEITKRAVNSNTFLVVPNKDDIKLSRDSIKGDSIIINFNLIKV